MGPHPYPPPLAGEGVRRASGGRVGTTIGAALETTAAALAAVGLDQPRRHARQLIAAALDLTAAEVFGHPERSLDGAEMMRVFQMLRRTAAHEPLSRIVGRREFWGLEFLLSAETLDPRPDSETVVEAVLARLPARDRPYRFLDLGTGTGCLLLALLSEFPNANGLGIDLAAGAARTARRNAERLGLGDRASFLAGNWAQAVNGRFDAIVTNPPYVASGAIADLPPEVRDHDPRAALDGGADGLAAYRAIAADLVRLLLPGAIFAAEVGHGQAGMVAEIVAEAGLRLDGVARDLAGIERCVVATRQASPHVEVRTRRRQSRPVGGDTQRKKSIGMQRRRV